MKLEIILLSLSLAQYTLQDNSLPAYVKDCHPKPSEEKVHYLIGYGSLINAESKSKTYPETGINIPVKVSGFTRSWTARGQSNSSLSTTYLGVDIDPESSFNGVIFSVPDYNAVQKYDQREAIYCRVKVPFEDITILRGMISDNATFPSVAELQNSEFWIYVTIPKFNAYPDEQYPIVQSYVDIFIGGCLQMEKKYGLSNFAEECVTKTQGWEYPWVNDRIHPRRPWAYQSNAGAIDRLLTKHLTDLPNRVYIEKIFVGRSAGVSANLMLTGYVPIVATTVLTLFHQLL